MAKRFGPRLFLRFSPGIASPGAVTCWSPCPALFDWVRQCASPIWFCFVRIFLDFEILLLYNHGRPDIFGEQQNSFAGVCEHVLGASSESKGLGLVQNLSFGFGFCDFNVFEPCFDARLVPRRCTCHAHHRKCDGCAKFLFEFNLPHGQTFSGNRNRARITTPEQLRPSWSRSLGSTTSSKQKGADQDQANKTRKDPSVQKPVC